MGGVTLLASEARNDRRSRRGTPPTYPAGPRGRLPACAPAPTPARQPCGVGQVGTRRAPGPVPGRVPRAPSVRSRYRPVADPESSSSRAARLSKPWALVKENTAQGLPLSTRRGPSSRMGQSCAPRHPALTLRASRAQCPSQPRRPLLGVVGTRRASDTAPSQCGCGWL